jgi:hypothetical protein
MLQKSRELIYAVIAMVFITLGYLIVQVVNQETPPASSLWGHGIGILGFVLMLMTETLYSLRKRSRRARWGKMNNWLEFHIFTGLVGPFMVLLHPGWQFKGLAGVLSLLTVLIVISGFIGRYIYTAIPRTADGIELTLVELEQQAGEIENALARLAAAGQASAAEIPTTPARGGNREAGADARRMGQTRARLQRERERLRRIIARRQTARRLFSLWHNLHIPLGLTLFLIAFIHIGAAIYYSVLLN